MTLSFKDPNGREWELRAHRVDYGDSRFAEPADLLSALGQLATGSDGPTDEELRAVRRCISAASKNETVTDSTLSDALRAADRVDALFAAGFASRQAEVDRLTAELADEKRHSRNQRGELNRFNRQVRADYEAMPLRHQLESELTATRAKLAEVERSRDLHSQERQRLDRKEYELLAEIDELTHELASARRALEAVNATLEKGPRYTDRHMEAAADAVADEIREAMALASAGTDADRTEQEERRCFACGDRLMPMWFAPEFCDEQCAEAYGRLDAGHFAAMVSDDEDVLAKFDAAREELKAQGIRIRASDWLEPTEASKPEPQAGGELQPAAQLDASDREPGEDEQRHDHDDRT